MPSSDQGSLGKEPKSFDKRHGRFRARATDLGFTRDRRSKEPKSAKADLGGALRNDVPKASRHLAEHALEDGVDVPEVMVEVEISLELGLAEMLAHVLVGREERQEVAFALPHLHGVALDDGIRVLARDA